MSDPSDTPDDLTHMPGEQHPPGYQEVEPGAPPPGMPDWGQPPNEQIAQDLRRRMAQPVPVASPDELNAELRRAARRAAQQSLPWFRRTGIVAVVTVVVLALGTAASVYIHDAFFTQPITQSAGNPVPTVPVVPIRKTNLQQTLDQLGPWHSVATTSDDTASPAILELKQDNGVVASTRYTVTFEGNPWTEVDTPPQVEAVTVAGKTMVIQSNSRQVFTVGVNQPLLFEQQPDRLIMIDPSGRFWKLLLDNPQVKLAPLSGPVK